MSSSESPTGHRVGEPPRRGGVLAMAVLAVVLSLAALGLSAWTAFGPAGNGVTRQSYTTDQQAAAKTAMCAAADVVRRGVALNTNLQSPGGEGDVTGSLAVAANARLSLSDGGLYLLARLDPAAPAELADAVKHFANTLVDIGAAATAGAANGDPDQAARLHDVDGENARLASLCA